MITVILIIAGCFLILGFVFRIFSPLNVLSGISAENVTDRDGLGRWVGYSLIIFAFIYLAIAGGLHVLGMDLSNAPTSMLIFTAVFLTGQGVIVSYIMGTGWFTKQTEPPPREISPDE